MTAQISPSLMPRRIGLPGGAGGEEGAGAGLAVGGVVGDPGFAQDLPAEAAVEAGLLAGPAVLFVGALAVGRVVERVRRGAHADHGPARLDVIHDVLHLLVGQRAEPGEDDHQVGVVQGLQARDVVVGVRVDLAGLLVDGEEDGAGKPVALGQDVRQQRQAGLRPVLVGAGDEDDVLALAGAVLAFEAHPLPAGVVGPRGGGECRGEREQCEEDGRDCPRRARRNTKKRAERGVRDTWHRVPFPSLPVFLRAPSCPSWANFFL